MTAYAFVEFANIESVQAIIHALVSPLAPLFELKCTNTARTESSSAARTSKLSPSATKRSPPPASIIAPIVGVKAILEKAVAMLTLLVVLSLFRSYSVPTGTPRFLAARGPLGPAVAMSSLLLKEVDLLLVLDLMGEDPLMPEPMVPCLLPTMAASLCRLPTALWAWCLSTRTSLVL